MPPPPLTVHLPVVASRLLRRRIALSRWLKLALVPEVMLARVSLFKTFLPPPCHALVFLTGCFAFVFLLFGWNTARVFLSFPPRFVV